MIPAKIQLTDDVINRIKTARLVKRIPAVELSKAIKRDGSYISSLELKRLKNISAADFISILRYLFDIPENKAIEKAEIMLDIAKKDIAAPYLSLEANSAYDKNNEHISINETPEQKYRYGDDGGNANPELISDMLDDIAGLISDFYKKEPKETVFALNSFIKTFKFDPMFTLQLMEMPFFSLKSGNIDIRIKVLADLSAVLKKHIAALKTYANQGSGTRLANGDIDDADDD